MAGLECLQGPSAPPGIVQDYVQEDIRIHQDQGSLTTARQGQDVLSPHLHSGSAPQPGEPILQACDVGRMFAFRRNRFFGS